MKTETKVLIVGGLLLSLYLKSKASGAVDAVGAAVNPLSKDNIFHSGANAVGASLSGDKNFSLGGWIYDITH